MAPTVIALAADENVHGKVVRGLQRRQPELDLVRVQDSDVAGAGDGAVLEWAAQQGRVVVTGDVSTLISTAYARVRAGQPMRGVIVVTGEVPIGRAIDDLEILATCSREGEWEGQVI